MNLHRPADPLQDKQARTHRIMPLLIAALLAVCLMLAGGSATRGSERAAGANSRLARCERLAAAAIEGLAAKGIDVEAPAWQRQRAAAVLACTKDFANFEWMADDSP